jgi:hypothetical protein
MAKPPRTPTTSEHRTRSVEYFYSPASHQRVVTNQQDNRPGDPGVNEVQPSRNEWIQAAKRRIGADYTEVAGRWGTIMQEIDAVGVKVGGHDVTVKAS